MGRFFPDYSNFKQSFIFKPFCARLKLEKMGNYPLKRS
jgi:hypothetical protein